MTRNEDIRRLISDWQLEELKECKKKNLRRFELRDRKKEELRQEDFEERFLKLAKK